MPNVGMLSTTILGVLASKMFAYLRIFLCIFVLFLQNGLLKQKLHSISSLIEIRKKLKLFWSKQNIPLF